MGKTPAEILRGAAENLRRHGWCQGNYRNALGQLCMAGAIECALDDHTDGDTISACYQAAENAAMPGYPISYWNDRPDRTAADVISALESAASSLEQSQ